MIRKKSKTTRPASSASNLLQTTSALEIEFSGNFVRTLDTNGCDSNPRTHTHKIYGYFQGVFSTAQRIALNTMLQSLLTNYWLTSFDESEFQIDSILCPKPETNEMNEIDWNWQIHLFVYRLLRNAINRCSMAEFYGVLPVFHVNSPKFQSVSEMFLLGD